MRKALSAAFVIAATLAVTSAQEPIAIGIVRDDGLLMPIAFLTPQLFRDPSFPAETLVNGELTSAVEKPPPPRTLEGRTWTVSQGRRAKPFEIKTIDVEMVQMPYCSDQLLWRTTLKGKAVRDNVAPFPKFGMAVSGASIEFPDDVATPPDEASKRVANRIVTLFLNKERQRLSEERGSYALSTGPGAPAVVIRRMLRHSAGGRVTYYFEATRDYKFEHSGKVFTAPQAGLLTGWIADSAAGLKDYEVDYKINDDGRKENDRAIVRGIVHYAQRAVWLLEWHGWETAYYTLHDWPSGVRRLTVDEYNCS